VSENRNGRIPSEAFEFEGVEEANQQVEEVNLHSFVLWFLDVCVCVCVW
jgi:hypothetical protein